MSQRGLQFLISCIFQILILSSLYTVEGGIKEQEGKIVGGSYADIKDFPHSVFLDVSCDKVAIVCSSSVLNQRILMTAAHCLPCKENFNINAYAGDGNIQQALAIRKVCKSYRHPDFKPPDMRNDIGLAVLTRNLPLGATIKRVIISRSYPKATIGYVAGWGVTNDETMNLSKNLKMVRVTIQPLEICSVFFVMDAGMLCAGTSTNTDNRPTMGDSGSALIIHNYRQIGIISYRKTIDVGMVVYTNVSYYYPWIKKKAKQLYCS